jgi:hypothetical protein
MLVPKGWTVEGGILRVDPTAAGGPGNSGEAKLGMAVKRDAEATVAVAWLPHVYRKDPRHIGMAAGQFPVGSNYMGMPVRPYTGPFEYAKRIVVPELHGKRIENLKVLEEKPLPGLAKVFQSFGDRLAGVLNPYLGQALKVSIEAGSVMIEYDEGGVRYREVITVVSENQGPLVGRWTNRLTVIGRAPAAEFEVWAPVLLEIAYSPEVDARWVRGEVRGQMERARIALRTQAEVQAIENAITENRRDTNATIAEHEHLSLTGREKYEDPFTGKRRIGSALRDYYVNEGGEVISLDGEAGQDVRSKLEEKGFRRMPDVEVSED